MPDDIGDPRCMSPVADTRGRASVAKGERAGWTTRCDKVQRRAVTSAEVPRLMAAYRRAVRALTSCALG